MEGEAKFLVRACESETVALYTRVVVAEDPSFCSINSFFPPFLQQLASFLSQGHASSSSSICVLAMLASYAGWKYLLLLSVAGHGLYKREREKKEATASA